MPDETSAPPAAARPGPDATTAQDFARFGPVHLDVTDAGRSLRFWRDVVGLSLRQQEPGGISLGVADAELVVLHPGAVRPAARGHSGLYHLAIHLPSEAEFARVLGRLMTERYPNSPTDHVMHWATYLDDPDGIGLELSFETLDRFDRYVVNHGFPAVVDARGRLRRGTDRLDLHEVFAHLPDDDLARPLPAGTRIGHLHLHVGDIPAALRFYAAIGFTPNENWERVGMGDMSAGGSFPHRLALNTWEGPGASPPPQGTAGLRHGVLRLGAPTAVAAAAARLALASDRGEPVLAVDPSGNRIELVGS